MLSRILSRQQLHYLQNLSAHIPSRVADLIFPCLVGAFYVVIFLITFYYVGRGVNNAAAVGALGGEKHKVAVIGAGFSGLAACLELNRLGYDVTVYERLPAVGGRAQHVIGKTSNHERFQFDFGPSWYWFPDVFEAIFQRYGGKVSEFYSLKKLDPAYRVFTESSEEDGEHAVGQSQSTDGGSGSGSPAVPSLIDVPGDAEDLLNFLANKEHAAFVQREMPGGRGARAAESTASASAPSAAIINHPERLALRLFFREAHEKYVTGIYEWIWKPMVSWFEFLDPALVSAALRMDMFNGFTSHISKYVHDHWVQKILKWPVIFVGASPKAAPALYSLMTYGGHMLGTWYPENGKGFRAPVEALEHLAKRNGVKFELSAEITELQFGEAAAAVGVGTSETGETTASRSTSASSASTRTPAPATKTNPFHFHSSTSVADNAVRGVCFRRREQSALELASIFEEDINENKSITAPAPPTTTASCSSGYRGVVASADYRFVEQKLLPARFRRYEETRYWKEQMVFSPSVLLFYLGFNTTIPHLLHHNFFFDTDLDANLENVFAVQPAEHRKRVEGSDHGFADVEAVAEPEVVVEARAEDSTSKPRRDLETAIRDFTFYVSATTKTDKAGATYEAPAAPDAAAGAASSDGGLLDFSGSSTAGKRIKNRNDEGPAPKKDLEALFVLIPTPYTMNDLLQKCQDRACQSAFWPALLRTVLNRMEKKLQLEENVLKNSLVYERHAGTKEFESGFHSYRGNAFGLANTLTQSLIFKPSLESKVANLVFAGHLTNPGPGVPPSLVSGVVAANLLHEKLQGLGSLATESGGNKSITEFVATVCSAFAGMARHAWHFASQEIPDALLKSTAWGLARVERLFFNARSSARKNDNVAFPEKSSEQYYLTALEHVNLTLLFLVAPFSLLVLGVFLKLKNDKLTRSYCLAVYLMWKHGTTYFGAATLMDFRRFLDTAAMYGLFRVADDYVDTVDAEAPRKEQLEHFVRDFWECWRIANRKMAGGGKGPQYQVPEQPEEPLSREPSTTSRKSADEQEGSQTSSAHELAEPEEYEALMELFYCRHPILPAVIDTSIRRNYPHTLFRDFFKSMMIDGAARVECQHFDDLVDYMKGSAAVIGDFMLPILCPALAEVLPRVILENELAEMEGLEGSGSVSSVASSSSVPPDQDQSTTVASSRSISMEFNSSPQFFGPRARFNVGMGNERAEHRSEEAGQSQADVVGRILSDAAEAGSETTTTTVRRSYCVHPPRNEGELVSLVEEFERDVRLFQKRSELDFWVKLRKRNDDQSAEVAAADERTAKGIAVAPASCMALQAEEETSCSPTTSSIAPSTRQLIQLHFADSFEQAELCERAVFVRKHLLPTARALGNAFQLTNMIRDIDEDIDYRRVYMPKDLLDCFGIDLELKEGNMELPWDSGMRVSPAGNVIRGQGSPAAASGTPADTASSRVVSVPRLHKSSREVLKEYWKHVESPPVSKSYTQWSRFLEFMMSIADGYYAEARPGIAALPGEVRDLILFSAVCYQKIHAEIRTTKNYHIFAHNAGKQNRARVSFRQKLHLATKLVSLKKLCRIFSVSVVCSLVMHYLVVCGGLAATFFLVESWHFEKLLVLGKTCVATLVMELLHKEAVPATDVDVDGDSQSSAIGPMALERQVESLPFVQHFTYFQYHCIWIFPSIYLLRRLLYKRVALRSESLGIVDGDGRSAFAAGGRGVGLELGGYAGAGAAGKIVKPKEPCTSACWGPPGGCSRTLFNFVCKIPVVPTLLRYLDFTQQVRLHRNPYWYLDSWRFWTAILCLVATLYTIVWDNYLVYRGVWGYETSSRVLLVIGWVPIEEYLFFSLETILAALIWALHYPNIDEVQVPPVRCSGGGTRSAEIGFPLSSRTSAEAASGASLLSLAVSLYSSVVEGVLYGWGKPSLVLQKMWSTCRNFMLGKSNEQKTNYAARPADANEPQMKSIRQRGYAVLCGGFFVGCFLIQLAGGIQVPEIEALLYPRGASSTATPPPAPSGSAAAQHHRHDHPLPKFRETEGSSGLYLGLILVWSMPVLLLQFYYGAECLHKSRWSLGKIILASAGFLSLTDVWAIRHGVWKINSIFVAPLTLQPFGKHLPFEEAFFFLVSSTMCIWGLHLALTVVCVYKLHYEGEAEVEGGGDAGAARRSRGVTFSFLDALLAVHFWAVEKKKQQEEDNCEEKSCLQNAANSSGQHLTNKCDRSEELGTCGEDRDTTTRSRAIKEETDQDPITEYEDGVAVQMILTTLFSNVLGVCSLAALEPVMLMLGSWGMTSSSPHDGSRSRTTDNDTAAHLTLSSQVWFLLVTIPLVGLPHGASDPILWLVLKRTELESQAANHDTTSDDSASKGQHLRGGTILSRVFRLARSALLTALGLSGGARNAVAAKSGTTTTSSRSASSSENGGGFVIWLVWYLTLMALTYAIWSFSAVTALNLFLLTSIYHFGEGDTVWWDLMLGRTGGGGGAGGLSSSPASWSSSSSSVVHLQSSRSSFKSTPRRIKSALRFLSLTYVRGGMFLVTIANAPLDTLRAFVPLTGTRTLEGEERLLELFLFLQALYQIHFVVTVFVVVAGMLRSSRRSSDCDRFPAALQVGETVEILVLYCLFRNLPPLLAFGIYFNFYHSLRHLLLIWFQYEKTLVFAGGSARMSAPGREFSSSRQHHQLQYSGLSTTESSESEVISETARRRAGGTAVTKEFSHDEVEMQRLGDLHGGQERQLAGEFHQEAPTTRTALVKSQPSLSPWKFFGLVVVFFTAATCAGAGLLFFLFSSAVPEFLGHHMQLLFIGLSCVTTPHMIMVALRNSDM